MTSLYDTLRGYLSSSDSSPGGYLGGVQNYATADPALTITDVQTMLSTATANLPTEADIQRMVDQRVTALAPSNGSSGTTGLTTTEIEQMIEQKVAGLAPSSNNTQTADGLTSAEVAEVQQLITTSLTQAGGAAGSSSPSGFTQTDAEALFLTKLSHALGEGGMIKNEVNDLIAASPTTTTTSGSTTRNVDAAISQMFPKVCKWTPEHESAWNGFTATQKANALSYGATDYNYAGCGNFTTEDACAANTNCMWTHDLVSEMQVKGIVNQVIGETVQPMITSSVEGGVTSGISTALQEDGMINNHVTGSINNSISIALGADGRIKTTFDAWTANHVTRGGKPAGYPVCINDGSKVRKKCGNDFVGDYGPPTDKALGDCNHGATLGVHGTCMQKWREGTDGMETYQTLLEDTQCRWKPDYKAEFESKTSEEQTAALNAYGASISTDGGCGLNTTLQDCHKNPDSWPGGKCRWHASQ